MFNSEIAQLATQIVQEIMRHVQVEPTLNLSQAAQAVGMDTRTFRQILEKGEIPYRKKDDSYLIRVIDINNWIGNFDDFGSFGDFSQECVRMRPDAFPATSTDLQTPAKKVKEKERKKEPKKEFKKKETKLLNTRACEEPLFSGNPDPERREEIPYENLIPLAINSAAFRQTWQEWIGYRRHTLLKPVKEDTARRQLKALESFGEPAAIESLKNSMLNGWQGIFKPRNFPNQPNNNSNRKDPTKL